MQKIKQQKGKPGLYKINCEKWDKCFVGQPKNIQYIKVRFKEHLRNIKKTKKKKNLLSWSTLFKPYYKNN